VRRMIAVLAGVVLAVAGAGLPAAGAAGSNSWPRYGHDAQHIGTNPAEHAFNTGNIANLKVVSKAHLGDNVLDRDGPVVVDERLYIGGTDGTLSVFATAGCACESCEPVWRAQMDRSINFAVAVADGLVLVGSPNEHALFAFPAAGCGGATCKPLWIGRMLDGATGAVTAAGAMAYLGDISGHLCAFRTAGCGRSVCSPLWIGVRQSDEALGTSAVGDGYVYVDTLPFTPELFTGRVPAFPAAGCGSATCKPLWIADIGGPGTRVTVADDTVFTNSSTLFGEGTNTGFHLMAFAAGGCGGPECKPAWVGVGFASAPTSPRAVVDDVILVGKGPASGFPVDSGFFTYKLRGCGAAICLPISLVQLGGQQGYNGAPLAVAEHEIFMVSTDNTDGHSNV
jgi:hypothetical protein